MRKISSPQTYDTRQVLRPDDTPSVVARSESVMKELDARPELLDDILLILCNGGSLITCADKLGVPYSRLSVWLNGNEERRIRVKEAMAARDEYLIQRILDELKAIGLHDVRELFKEDGSLRPLKEIPESLTKCIAGIDIVESFDKDGTVNYVKRIRMIDKLKGIELLSKAMVGFIEKKQISVEHTYKVQDFDITERLKMLSDVIDVPAQEPTRATDVRPANAGVPQDL